MKDNRTDITIIRTPTDVTFKCPHCKAYIEMDIDDFECMMIDEIPYWEDEEFCCPECGEDIVVNDVDWN